MPVGLKLQLIWRRYRDLLKPNFERSVGTFNWPIIQFSHLFPQLEIFIRKYTMPLSLTMESISTSFGPSNGLPNILIILSMIPPWGGQGSSNFTVNQCDISLKLSGSLIISTNFTPNIHWMVTKVILVNYEKFLLLNATRSVDVK